MHQDEQKLIPSLIGKLTIGNARKKIFSERLPYQESIQKPTNWGKNSPMCIVQ